MFIVFHVDVLGFHYFRKLYPFNFLIMPLFSKSYLPNKCLNHFDHNPLSICFIEIHILYTFGQMFLYFDMSYKVTLFWVTKLILWLYVFVHSTKKKIFFWETKKFSVFYVFWTQAIILRTVVRRPASGVLRPASCVRRPASGVRRTKL